MKTKLISKKKNHVMFTLVFTPDELKAHCDGVLTADVVQTLIVESSGKVLNELGLKAAAPPASEFNEEDLTAAVTVTCLPVLEEKHYKGIVLKRVKGPLSTEEAEAQLKDMLIDKLIESVDFDLAQTVYENDVKMLAHGLGQQMKYEAMARGEFLNPLDEGMDNRMREIEEEVVKQLKAELLLNAIIQAERLDVTREELEEGAKAISIRQKMSVEMVKDFLGDDLAALRKDMLTKKALDLVLVNAIIQ